MASVVPDIPTAPEGGETIRGSKMAGRCSSMASASIDAMCLQCLFRIASTSEVHVSAYQAATKRLRREFAKDFPPPAVETGCQTSRGHGCAICDAADLLH